MPTVLLENPLVKRPDADPHRDFTLTSATGMPASCIPQALLSIFLSRVQFSPLCVFPRSSKRESIDRRRRHSVNIVLTDITCVVVWLRAHQAMKIAAAGWHCEAESIRCFCAMVEFTMTIPPRFPEEKCLDPLIRDWNMYAIAICELVYINCVCVCICHSILFLYFRYLARSIHNSLLNWSYF